ERLGLLDLGGAGIVGEHGNDVALVHVRAALDPKLGQHTAGARRHCDALVGLGTAGDHELAVVRDDAGLDHRNAKRLLHFALTGTKRGAAFRALVRHEMPGRDPQRGRRDQPDGGNAARFHRDFSSLIGMPWGRLRSMWRTTSMKIGTTAAGSKSRSSARRHHTPSAMIISMVTTPSRSTSVGMSPRAAAARKSSRIHFFTSASNEEEMRAISGLRRASAMTSVHSSTCSVGRTAKWWCAIPSSTANRP